MSLNHCITPTRAAPALHATPTVFIVDDDCSVREALRLLLHAEGLESVLFASAREFLAQPRIPGLSCLILDVTLPDVSGFDLQHLIADRRETPIIFVTGHGTIPMSVRAMKAGAIEFLTKPFDAAELLGAIHQAFERSREALHQDSSVRALKVGFDSLSRREREVMALVVSGLLNKQVGSALGISDFTVKKHRGRVMRKMRIRSFAELVRAAGTLGLTSAAHGTDSRLRA